MIKPKRIIVVGGNAAGPAAASKAKRFNPDAEVLLFEAGSYISTGTCEMPYVLSGEIEDYKKIIFFSPEQFYKEKGVKVFINHKVESINLKDKKIFVNDILKGSQEEFYYDKLVLATGSIPRNLEKFQPGLKNVHNLKNVQDLVNILELVNKDSVKNAVIIGSGYIGIEAADALHKRGISITILEKYQYPLPSSEIDIQHLTYELLKQNEISFYGNADKIKITTSGDYLRSINLDSRLLEFDLILNVIGSVPNVELAKNCGLEIGLKGGIKVDLRLRTSCQDIYAAGDCIEVTNAITNRPDYFPLATLAHDYGHIAGENAAGGNKRVDPVVKNLSVKIFDKCLVTIGLSSEEAKKEKYLFGSVQEVVPNLIEVMPGSDKIFGKIIYEKESKRILGATFFGGREVSGYGDLISAFIKSKLGADVLASINYNYTPPLSPFVNLLSVLGRKIK